MSETEMIVMPQDTSRTNLNYKHVRRRQKNRANKPSLPSWSAQITSFYLVHQPRSEMGSETVEETTALSNRLYHEKAAVIEGASAEGSRSDLGCPVCKLLFSGLKQLSQHILIHLNEEDEEQCEALDGENGTFNVNGTAIKTITDDEAIVTIKKLSSYDIMTIKRELSVLKDGPDKKKGMILQRKKILPQFKEVMSRFEKAITRFKKLMERFERILPPIKNVTSYFKSNRQVFLVIRQLRPENKLLAASCLSFLVPKLYFIMINPSIIVKKNYRYLKSETLMEIDKKLSARTNCTLVTVASGLGVKSYFTCMLISVLDMIIPTNLTNLPGRDLINLPGRDIPKRGICPKQGGEDVATSCKGRRTNDGLDLSEILKQCKEFSNENRMVKEMRLLHAYVAIQEQRIAGLIAESHAYALNPNGATKCAKAVSKSTKNMETVEENPLDQPPIDSEIVLSGKGLHTVAVRSILDDEEYTGGQERTQPSSPVAINLEEEAFIKSEPGDSPFDEEDSSDFIDDTESTPELQKNELQLSRGTGVITSVRSLFVEEEGHGIEPKRFEDEAPLNTSNSGTSDDVRGEPSGTETQSRNFSPVNVEHQIEFTPDPGTDALDSLVSCDSREESPETESRTDILAPKQVNTEVGMNSLATVSRVLLQDSVGEVNVQVAGDENSSVEYIIPDDDFPASAHDSSSEVESVNMETTPNILSPTSQNSNQCFQEKKKYLVYINKEGEVQVTKKSQQQDFCKRAQLHKPREAEVAEQGSSSSTQYFIIVPESSGLIQSALAQSKGPPQQTLSRDSEAVTTAQAPKLANAGSLPTLPPAKQAEGNPSVFNTSPHLRLISSRLEDKSFNACYVSTILRDCQASKITRLATDMAFLEHIIDAEYAWTHGKR
ncbi:unnamed protein product [Cyprideis torosa]|uniref:Uncharacterized protein n=1 Tax=Cyprideis torosa TaxID=163714 RepID=A0A7R8ZJ70_9CRUS|nr:unnamed protein product [Cyprideis torosa]CAG0887962.1 unnamed protein product [Cyprideis torosa]